MIGKMMTFILTFPKKGLSLNFPSSEIPSFTLSSKRWYPHSSSHLSFNFVRICFLASPQSEYKLPAIRDLCDGSPSAHSSGPREAPAQGGAQWTRVSESLGKPHISWEVPKDPLRKVRAVGSRSCLAAVCWPHPCPLYCQDTMWSWQSSGRDLSIWLTSLMSVDFIMRNFLVPSAMVIVTNPWERH